MEWELLAFLHDSPETILPVPQVPLTRRDGLAEMHEACVTGSELLMLLGPQHLGAGLCQCSFKA